MYVLELCHKMTQYFQLPLLHYYDDLMAFLWLCTQISKSDDVPLKKKCACRINISRRQCHQGAQPSAVLLLVCQGFRCFACVVQLKPHSLLGFFDTAHYDIVVVDLCANLLLKEVHRILRSNSQNYCHTERQQVMWMMIVEGDLNSQKQLLSFVMQSRMSFTALSLVTQ